jgi:hypothetical protein
MENTLTQDAQSKVTLIAELNDLHKMITGEPLSADQFDGLYDLSLEELLQAIEGAKNRIQIMRFMQHFRVF